MSRILKLSFAKYIPITFCCRIALSSAPDLQAKVEVSYMEVYNEKVREVSFMEVHNEKAREASFMEVHNEKAREASYM